MSSEIKYDAVKPLTDDDKTLAAEERKNVQEFVAARSRFAEAELAAALERGVSQYVVLGAGLDTFAGRSPYPAADLRVFEVDHPDAREWRQSNVQRVPPVTFVPTDFETETLSDALRRSGFKPGLATLFSWLGATLYSTPEAAMASLRFIASMPRESGLLFDYAVERSSRSPLGQMAMDALASRAAAAGDAFRLLLQPEALKGMLKAFGFWRIDDVGPGRIEGRYFERGLRGSDTGLCLAHLVDARV
jgi:methyltransferase (TIGR00027 family)